MVEQQMTDELERLRQRVAELENGQELLKALLENAPDAIYLNDLKGTFVDANRAAEELVGYPRDELLGKSFLKLGLLPAGQIPRAAVLLARNALGHPTGPDQFRLNRKDGDQVVVEIRTYPVKLRDRVLVMGIARDVTERKAAEEALDRERAYFGELFESSPEAIVLVNNEARVLRQNREFTRLFGYSPEEAAGQSVDDLVTPPGLRAEAASYTARATAGGRVSAETVRQTRDGRLIDVSILGAPIRTEAGQIAVCAVYRDITEQKRSDEILLQAQKLDSMSVMAGGIAHEFNNLLVSVLGNAELALMDLPPDSPVRQSVAAIQKAALRAADLTNQMLAYSGKGRFAVQRLDASKLVAEMEPWMKAGAPADAVIVCDLARGLPPFDGDMAQIRQAVTAVFSNAVEALEGKPGTVTVSTGVRNVDSQYLAGTFLADELSEGPYVYIRVSDNGCGMDGDVRKRIFDPFYSTKFTGRGLGLPATLGIARGHSGTVRVETEPGRGTSVTILFPAVRPVEDACRGEAAPEAGPWRGGGVVLVIDDEEGVRAVARAVLEKSGFEVIEAGGGREGIEVFREHEESIVAVLLDRTMPEMNGADVFRQIRGRGSDVPVVLMSGFLEEDAVGPLSGEGPTAFLQKPFRPAALIDILRRALDRRGAGPV